MFTRRKFMGSAASLGAMAVVSPMPRKTVYAETSPVAVYCHWGDHSPEKIGVILYADLEKKEFGARYVMEGTYDPRDKGQEVRLWLPLEDVRRAYKEKATMSVLRSRMAGEKLMGVQCCLTKYGDWFSVLMWPSDGRKEGYRLRAAEVRNLLFAIKVV